MAATDSYYLKADEVAERLKIDRSHVYRLIKSGQLPSIRLSEKTVRVPRGGLDAFLAARTSAGSVEPRRADYSAVPVGAEEARASAQDFEERIGCDPFAFVHGWRTGEIADTAENSERVVEALALRGALQSAGVTPQSA